MPNAKVKGKFIVRATVLSAPFISVSSTEQLTVITSQTRTLTIITTVIILMLVMMMMTIRIKI